MALETTFAAVINLTNPSMTSTGDFTSAILSLIFLALNIGLTFVIPVLLINKRHQYQGKFMRKYFSELIENLRTNVAACFYYSAFMIRRIAFVALVFLLEEHVGI